MTRRLPLLALGLLGLGLLAWLLAPAPDGGESAGGRGDAAAVAGPGDPRGARAGEPDPSALAGDGAGRSASAEAAGAPEDAAASRRSGLTGDAPAELDAGPRAFVVGRVLDASTRSPLAGAQVQLVDDGAAQTDDAGEFRLAVPAGGTGAVVASAEGFLELRRPGVALPAAEGGELALELALEPAATLTLVVEPTPVAGDVPTRVFLWRRSSPSTGDWPQLELEVDADGRAVFGDLAAGDYAAYAEGPIGVAPFRAGLSLETGERRVERLRLERGGVVEVSFRTQPGGAPVEGAAIELRPRRTGMPWRAERAFARDGVTDARGRVRFDGLPTGDYRLEGRVPWADVDYDSFELASSIEPREIELECSAPGTLLGRVVDEAGDGIAGAVVRVAPRDERGASEVLFGAESDASRAVETETDADGAFELDAAPAGERLVVVASPPEDRVDLVPRVVNTSALPAGQPGPPITLELVAGAVVTGEVVDTDGEPIPFASVRLEVVAGRGSMEWLRTDTDEAGAFELGPVPEGNAVVEAEAEGFLDDRDWLGVEAGVEPEPVRLELRPAHELAGRVVDRDGFAVEGARVEARLADEGDSRGERNQSRRLRRDSTSDAYGAFVLRGVVQGEWRIGVDSSEWRVVDVAPTRPAVPADAFVEVVVEPSRVPRDASLEGVVAAAEGGPPPTGVRLDGPSGGVLSVDEGRFTLSGLEAGRTRVVVRADGRVPKDLGTVDLVAGAPTDLGTIELVRTIRVAVRVEDAQGERIRDADVRLQPLPVAAGGTGEEDWTRRLRPNRSGTYSTDWGVEGAWRLVVRRQGFRTHRETLQVRPPTDGTQPHRVRLTPGG